MTSKYLYLFVISHSTQSHKTAVFPLWLQWLIAFQMAEFHSYWFSGAGWASVSDVVCVCLFIFLCFVLLNSCISETQRVYVHDLDWTHGLDRPSRERVVRRLFHKASDILRQNSFSFMYISETLWTQVSLTQREQRNQSQHAVWYKDAKIPSCMTLASRSLHIYILYMTISGLTGASLFSRHLQIQLATEAERAESKGQIEACGICVVFVCATSETQSEILTNVLAGRWRFVKWSGRFEEELCVFWLQWNKLTNVADPLLGFWGSSKKCMMWTREGKPRSKHSKVNCQLGFSYIITYILDLNNFYRDFSILFSFIALINKKNVIQN